VPATYHQHCDLNEGVLEVKANTTIDSLEIRNGGSLVSNQGTLTTSREISLQMGNVEGHIVGADAIRKTTNEYAHLGSLPGFAGNIYLEKGVLQIDSGDAFGTTAGATHVQGSRDAALIARGASVINDDIFLNNATGIDYAGGMRLDYAYYPQTLHMDMRGRLDLGAIGSVIGGTSSGVIDIYGPMTGGSLTTVGTGLRLQIQGNQNTYSGATNVRQGVFSLTGNGRLSNTSAIVLYDDVGSDKGWA
jgi:autotransporter-associated beta strand protein